MDIDEPALSDGAWVNHGPAPVFARELQEVRRVAGDPSLRRLHRASGRSTGALSAAEKGADFPTWRITKAYLRGCGHEPGSPEYRRIQDLWQRTEDALRPLRPDLDACATGPDLFRALVGLTEAAGVGPDALAARIATAGDAPFEFDELPASPPAEDDVRAAFREGWPGLNRAVLAWALLALGGDEAVIKYWHRRYVRLALDSPRVPSPRPAPDAAGHGHDPDTAAAAASRLRTEDPAATGRGDDEEKHGGQGHGGEERGGRATRGGGRIGHGEVPWVRAAAALAILATAALLLAADGANRDSANRDGAGRDDVPVLTADPDVAGRTAAEALEAILRRVVALREAAQLGRYTFCHIEMWSPAGRPGGPMEIRDEWLFWDEERRGVRRVTLTGADGRHSREPDEFYDGGRVLRLGIERPSSDAGELERQLREQQPGLGTNGVLRAVADLYAVHHLDRGRRAAVLEVVGRLPGLVLLGAQADRAERAGPPGGRGRSGRPGIAVAADLTTDGVTVRDVLLFDEATGALLSAAQTVVAAPAPDGLTLPAELRYTLYLDAGRSDTTA